VAYKKPRFSGSNILYSQDRIILSISNIVVPLCTASSSSLASCATFPPAIMQPHVAGHLNKNCVMSTGRGLTPYHSWYIHGEGAWDEKQIQLWIG